MKKTDKFSLEMTKRRKEMGMSRNALFHRSGIAYSKLCRLENGHIPPSFLFRTAIILSKILNWKLEDMAKAVEASNADR